MDCNKLLAKWQPTQLYVMLCLSTVYFLVELLLSHTTHALTLLMDAYHMMCNIIALTACILTVKHGSNSKNEATATAANISSVGNLNVNCRDQSNYEISLVGKHQENKLKNTFGWARIDVVFMLICFVFLASLSFSLVVEALQTLVHIDHHDEMHQPLIVLTVGSIGLLLNGLCYLLIGGYTFHQGSFLYVTESGNVILDRVVSGESVKTGGRRLSRTRNNIPVVPSNRQRQGFREMLRDVLGCVIVIITGLVVNFTNASVAKFVDPIFSISSAAMLIYLSYPYMKQSCLILLQTIPDTINIDSLKLQLVEHFPDIINIHDLHIWQLTTNKIISTVHVVFDNPKVYGKLMLELKEFFADNGISQVTIQPEFYKKSISLESLPSDQQKAQLCLMSCQSEKCSSSHCCQNQDVISNNVWQSKEYISTEPTADQNSVKSEKDENMSVGTGMVQRDVNKTNVDMKETS